MRRQVEESFDYVGPEFAEEARKIHYGETEERPIYGETSEQPDLGTTELWIANIAWAAGGFGLCWYRYQRMAVSR